jgi:uncharacterized protein (DUF169 family)
MDIFSIVDEKMDNREIASKLTKILKLKNQPIAVKLVKNEDLPEGLPTEPETKMRYCQLVMEAKKGRAATLTRDSISCPAAAAAFGLLSLPEKIGKGTMLKALGLFDSEEAAAELMAKMPRLPLGVYKAVAVAPLSEAGFTPDVVVLEEEPEKIMWISLASLHEKGGRLSFDTSVFQACCVDATVEPYLRGDINASFGCYGCRDATDIDDGEGLIGIPYGKLPEILEALERLSLKAMPQVQSKGVYHQFETTQRR